MSSPYSPALAAIATEFSKAVERKMKDDPGFETRFIKAVNEEDAFADITFIFGNAQARRRILGSDANSREFYAKEVIKGSDRLVWHFNAFCTSNEIKSMFPKNAFEKEIVDGFAACGATSLAEVCAPS